jgi:hypothetical protein
MMIKPYISVGNIKHKYRNQDPALILSMSCLYYSFDNRLDGSLLQAISTSQVLSASELMSVGSFLALSLTDLMVPSTGE